MHDKCTLLLLFSCNLPPALLSGCEWVALLSGCEWVALLAGCEWVALLAGCEWVALLAGWQDVSGLHFWQDVSGSDDLSRQVATSLTKEDCSRQVVQRKRHL